MKKINFYNFVVIVATFSWVGFSFYSYSNHEEYLTNIVISGIIYCIVCFASWIIALEEKASQESFSHPYTISENDAGKVFRVEKVDNIRIGVVRWGYKDCALQGFDNFPTYYWIRDIPKTLRNIDQKFQVVMTNQGLAFQKIKVNGFDDKSKPPFEALPEMLTV